MRIFNFNLTKLHRARVATYAHLRMLSGKKLIVIFCSIYLTLFILTSSHRGGPQSAGTSEDFEVNSFGTNINLPVNKSRYRDVPRAKLKNILFWNDAYGVRTYDVGFGHEHFYTNLCPDTRCYTTANRSYLNSVADFDAVVIHQVSFL